uniref:Tudor domain-containing protein n=1 Tax=Trichuris muris TaxID=70415 RepID=A0A5S6QF28_TRIMR
MPKPKRRGLSEYSQSANKMRKTDDQEDLLNDQTSTQANQSECSTFANDERCIEDYREFKANTIDPKWAGFRAPAVCTATTCSESPMKFRCDVDKFFSIPDSVEPEIVNDASASEPYDMCTDMETCEKVDNFTMARKYLPMETLLNKAFPKFRIVEAERTPIKILKWDDESSFTVRFEALDPLYEYIFDAMDIFYNAFTFEPLSYEYGQNFPCAVEAGKLWHRGMTLQLGYNGRVQVHLVDTSEVVWFPRRKVVPLAKIFALTPPLAVACCIHGSTWHEEKKWPPHNSRSWVMRHSNNLVATAEAYRPGKLAISLEYATEDESEGDEAASSEEPDIGIFSDDFLRMVEAQIESWTITANGSPVPAVRIVESDDSS